MTPTPSAFLTVSAATEATLWPRVWKQSTIFPLARVALRDPVLQLLRGH